ncbi:hypothetical protein Avbf_16174 [Armadillidium vulgare]|nr:hypothetical protein Avbf_11755 [Armadillidium vulgare]RXG52488.1 hypothetical protein Avbf_16174 [Armadillidium vulgare]
MYEDSTKGSFFGILSLYVSIDDSRYNYMILVLSLNFSESTTNTGNSIRLKIFKKQDISESNLN